LKTIGIIAVAALAATAEGSPDDHGHLMVNESPAKASSRSFRPFGLNRDVRVGSLNEPAFAGALRVKAEPAAPTE
jgi:hypothetical protein